MTRLVRRYEELLPVTCRSGRVACCRNVREILERTASRLDVRSYLLTGNTRGGARAKLDALRPVEVLSGRGVCRGHRRPRRRLLPGRWNWPDARDRSSEERLFVIGDTPHDVHAANAIGARTIAVATGGYTRRRVGVAPAMADLRGAAAAGRVPDADRRAR